MYNKFHITITQKHIDRAAAEGALLGQQALLVTTCAMHQALRSYVQDRFKVASNTIQNIEEQKIGWFVPELPDELYGGKYDLCKPNYEFEVWIRESCLLEDHPA